MYNIYIEPSLLILRLCSYSISNISPFKYVQLVKVYWALCEIQGQDVLDLHATHCFNKFNTTITTLENRQIHDNLLRR